MSGPDASPEPAPAPPSGGALRSAGLHDAGDRHLRAAQRTGQRRSWGWWAAIVVIFGIVATLNAGGYRFGASDQAFYVPAIQRHLEPDSFPRDRVIIDDQDRLTVSTTVAAWAIQASGTDAQTWFAIVYVAALGLLGSGAVAVARAIGLTPWAVGALVAALTLRHRVGITGANTLESYGHPRVLAFAVGVWAMAAFLRSRLWLACTLAGLAFLIHPTTALWFAIWLGGAVWWTHRSWRPWLTTGAALAGVLAIWVVWSGPLSGSRVVMDAEWLALLSTKDYLFPDRWPISGWLMAAGYVAAVAIPFHQRQTRALAAPPEHGMVAGLAVLLVMFLLSVPGTAAGLAVAVQFQVSRVFWLADFVGTVYVVWAVAGPTWNRRARIVTAVLVCAALGRGVYVKWIEHPERPVAQWDLPEDAWRDAMAWLRTQPLDRHVLAHPGHAWKYGSSVRVAAGRDVFLEEVKDSAMSMYSRRVAARVLERIPATADFDQTTADALRALAARYDLHYLVDERVLDLPVAYRNNRFTVYRLRD